MGCMKVVISDDINRLEALLNARGIIRVDGFIEHLTLFHEAERIENSVKSTLIVIGWTDDPKPEPEYELIEKEKNR